MGQSPRGDSISLLILRFFFSGFFHFLPLTKQRAANSAAGRFLNLHPTL